MAYIGELQKTSFLCPICNDNLVVGMTSKNNKENPERLFIKCMKGRGFNHTHKWVDRLTRTMIKQDRVVSQFYDEEETRKRIIKLDDEIIANLTRLEENMNEIRNCMNEITGFIESVVKFHPDKNITDAKKNTSHVGKSVVWDK
jgi:hypothetical protein